MQACPWLRWRNGSVRAAPHDGERPRQPGRHRLVAGRRVEEAPGLKCDRDDRVDDRERDRDQHEQGEQVPGVLARNASTGSASPNRLSSEPRPSRIAASGISSEKIVRSRSTTPRAPWRAGHLGPSAKYRPAVPWNEKMPCVTANTRPATPSGRYHRPEIDCLRVEQRGDGSLHVHEPQHGQQRERRHLDNQENPGDPCVSANVQGRVPVAAAVTTSAVASGESPPIATPR